MFLSLSLCLHFRARFSSTPLYIENVFFPRFKSSQSVTHSPDFEKSNVVVVSRDAVLRDRGDLLLRRKEIEPPREKEPPQGEKIVRQSGRPSHPNAEETDRDERQQRRVGDDFFKKPDGRERSVSVREGVQRLCVLLVSFIFVIDNCFFSLFRRERERPYLFFRLFALSSVK